MITETDRKFIEQAREHLKRLQIDKSINYVAIPILIGEVQITKEDTKPQPKEWSPYIEITFQRSQILDTEWQFLSINQQSKQ